MSEDFNAERRRYPRHRIDLTGRFMRDDGTEFDCAVLDVSLCGVGFKSDVAVKSGERIVAYVEDLGRFEGPVVRHFEGGFAIEFQMPALRRRRIQERIEWHMARERGETHEDRRHARIAPMTSEESTAKLHLPDGRIVDCRIEDMSLSGARVSTTARPALGSQVSLGKSGGKVVRHTSDGIAVEFDLASADSKRQQAS